LNDKRSEEFVVPTSNDPSDNALIAVWVIEAELGSCRRTRLDCTEGTGTRTPIGSPPLLVTSDPAAADQPFLCGPPT